MLCRVALGTQIVEQRINSEVKIKVLLKPMNNPLGVSPSKGKQGTTEKVGDDLDLFAAIHHLNRPRLSCDLVAQSAE